MGEHGQELVDVPFTFLQFRDALANREFRPLALTYHGAQNKSGNDERTGIGEQKDTGYIRRTLGKLPCSAQRVPECNGTYGRNDLRDGALFEPDCGPDNEGKCYECER